MKALVGAFNQEKALVGTFSVIVQLHRLIDLRHYLGEVDDGGGVGEEHAEADDQHHQHQGQEAPVLPPQLDSA